MTNLHPGADASTIQTIKPPPSNPSNPGQIHLTMDALAHADQVRTDADADANANANAING